MLQFFRKYQKIFFFFITIIIIASFVFFGASQAFGPSKNVADEVAFMAKDGSKVKKFHFHHLCRFLSEEGGAINFLNDGFVTKRFFDTKMGQILYAKNQESFAADLQERHGREKCFQPYVHPYARALSAEAIWDIFSPDTNVLLKHVKESENPGSLEAFKAKVALYQAEKKFSPELLAQVLTYQQRDNPGLPPDARLENLKSLSLFGYQNLEDWFGPKYIECLAQTILNGACIAKDRGLKVTKEEVKANLAHLVEKAFESYKDELPPQISSPEIFFAFLLREKGVDQETFISIWNELLLFNRLMEEVGSSVIIDSLAVKEFYSQAHEKIVCEVYRLPEAMRLKTEEDLKTFETYLSALQSKNEGTLMLPEFFDSVAEIGKRAPFLVAHPYRLEVAHVSKKDLQGKITVRETWEWETDPKNWDQLKEKFPQLKDSASLDGLERKKRLEVDQFARKCILKEHPDWVSSALENAKKEEKRLVIKGEGKGDLLKGIKDGLALKELLDREEKIALYTQDDENYYTIQVKAREEKEVLSYLEAKESKLLDSPNEKSFALMKEALTQALKKENLVVESVAPYRFYAYMKGLPTKEIVGLGAQWNLEKQEEIVSRGHHPFLSFEEVAAMEKDQISKVLISEEVGPYFYKVVEKKIDATLPIEKLMLEQKMLSQEACEHFFEKELLPLIDEKK